MRKKSNNDDAYKKECLAILTRHIGEEKTIGMGELYERVFKRRYNNRINSTRRLRNLITDLREEGVAIGSNTKPNTGGYHLIRSSSELEEYVNRNIAIAKKKLYMISRLKKVSLPEILGQLSIESINMEGKDVN